MPGPRISTNFLGMSMIVEAEYQPAEPGDRECPPTDECFDLGGIFAEDGKTPLALTDEQVERLTDQLLDEYHAEADYERYCNRRDCDEDVDPIDRHNRCP